MRVSAGYDSPRRRRSRNAAIVIDHFGVTFETGRRVIAAGIELPIATGDVVCFTGASGSGKSTLLRAVADQLRTPAATTTPAAAARLGVVDMAHVQPGDSLVIDAFGLPAAEAMRLLSACGLGEARLMLRTPNELSHGERYRLQLALALARQPEWILADEFTATLDRTLAKVIAYNIRRLADRTGTGFIIATTHHDIVEDLAPDLHVVCSLDGRIDVRRADTSRTEFHSVHVRRETVPSLAQPQKAFGVALLDERERCSRSPGKGTGTHAEPGIGGISGSGREPLPCVTRPLSLARGMLITRGRRCDWPYFARWHYRGSRLPATQFVTLLWEGDVGVDRDIDVDGAELRPTAALAGHPPSSILHPRSPTHCNFHHSDSPPIAICVFTAPPLALRERHRFFKQSGRWSRLRFQMLNRQLVTLARVVLHPSYRGAGIATQFVRRSCELCPWPWIEAQAAMGHVNPLFERAGFTRVGVSDRKSQTRRGHSSIYGTKASRHADKPLITRETFHRSRRARPVYYVFDNRRNARRGAFPQNAPGEERPPDRHH